MWWPLTQNQAPPRQAQWPGTQLKPGPGAAGTTSTIGVLIAPPDQTLALASRPVALNSPHIGWAEEDPEQWWANVGEIVRELLHTGGVSPADVAAVGVAGMLPAVVLLDVQLPPAACAA